MDWGSVLCIYPISRSFDLTIGVSCYVLRDIGIHLRQS